MSIFSLNMLMSNAGFHVLSWASRERLMSKYCSWAKLSPWDWTGARHEPTKATTTTPPALRTIGRCVYALKPNFQCTSEKKRVVYNFPFRALLCILALFTALFTLNLKNPPNHPKVARVGYLTNFLSRSGSGPCPAERAHGRTVAAISCTNNDTKSHRWTLYIKEDSHEGSVQCGLVVGQCALSERSSPNKSLVTPKVTYAS